MTICVHHWKLVDDLVENVPATCRNCGAEKVFPGGAPVLEMASYSYRSLDHSPQRTAESRSRGGIRGGAANAQRRKESA